MTLISIFIYESYEQEEENCFEILEGKCANVLPAPVHNHLGAVR